jgi:hypothetical protein
MKKPAVGGLLLRAHPYRRFPVGAISPGRAVSGNSIPIDRIVRRACQSFQAQEHSARRVSFTRPTALREHLSPRATIFSAPILKRDRSGSRAAPSCVGGGACAMP